ncbi:MAG: pantoate--beta-alanine ligase [Kiritimatiellae bacterium]|nr:pantoate--beta-alanine ligase [Kiritimatiellia bacterium]
MKIFTEPVKLQKWAESRRLAGKKIALVPTMGYLHEGHLSLIAAAKKKGADEIVVSIFVNPIQFGPNEDYARYPRDEKADLAKCRQAGATAVFFPTPDNMYAADHSVYINEMELGNSLCGARRPGHFRGVCTVVAKLFNLAKPHFAVFGQKDYQQETIIRRMVRDLNFDVKIVVAPIVREPSGLARSSRNTYLSDAERAQALALSAALAEARAEVKRAGEVDWKTCRARIVRKLQANKLKVDYVEAVDADTLKPVTKLVAKKTTVLLAVYCGATRLIDNAVM